MFEAHGLREYLHSVKRVHTHGHVMGLRGRRELLTGYHPHLQSHAMEGARMSNGARRAERESVCTRLGLRTRGGRPARWSGSGTALVTPKVALAGIMRLKSDTTFDRSACPPTTLKCPTPMKPRFILAGFALLLGCLPALAQGDTKIRDQVTNSMHDSVRNAIVDKAVQINPTEGGQLRDAVNSGALGIAGLSGPKEKAGFHDKTTILVNTQWSLPVCALTLLHEWRHIQRIPPDAPPSAKDSDDLNPCDDCGHARNNAKSHDDIVCALMAGLLSPEDACNALKGNDEEGAKNWNKCRHSMCTGSDAHNGGPYSGLFTKPTPECPPPR